MQHRARQFLLWAFLAALALPTVSHAQYRITTNGTTCTITGYTGTGGIVNITNKINGLTVTSIGDYAFEWCTSLTSVAIPNSVTSIGQSAFSECSSLTNVTIPNSISSIGDYTFESCTSLTKVTIGTNVTSIGQSAFSECSSLTNLTIPNSVTSIGGWAFGGTRLASVTISNSVTSIGNGAFSDCTSLTNITVNNGNPSYSSVTGVLFNKSQTTLLQYPGGKTNSYYTIPSSVTNIGFYAFECCTFLACVTIANSVASIKDGAFSDCTSLTNITVNNGNPAYSSLAGVLFNKSQTTLLQYPGGKTNSYYTIPGSITNIEGSAFYDCANLTNVTIPNSVTSIGPYAFSGTGLANVTIPASVTSIDELAFSWCTSLTSVTILNRVTSIGWDAFLDCSNLTNIYCCGNAPNLDGSEWFYGDPATVYYLPNTTGWGSSFGGLATILWNPRITPDATFGIHTNGFGFTFTNAGSPTVVIAACTNLTNPVWIPISTNTLISGSSYFRDPQWTNFPARFYRFQMP